MNSLRKSFLMLGFATALTPGAARAFQCGDYPNIPCAVENDETAKSGRCVASGAKTENEETRLLNKIEKLSGHKLISGELKPLTINDRGIAHLAHEYGHVVGRIAPWKLGGYNPFASTHAQNYAQTVKSPCRFTGASHVTTPEDPRGEEFAEVFAAYLTNPEMLNNGDPSCKEAVAFIRKYVLPAKDSVCDGGYPLKEIAGQPKPLAAAEDCEMDPAQVLGKNGQDLKQLAGAIETSQHAQAEAAAQAKANAEAEAKVEAEERREEKREKERKRKAKERREAEESSAKFSNAATSVVTVLAAAAPAIGITVLNYQAAKQQQDYVNSLTTQYNTTTAVQVQATATSTSPLGTRSVPILPVQTAPTLPGSTDPLNGTGR